MITAEFYRSCAVNFSGENIVGASKQDVSAEAHSGAVCVIAAAGGTPLLAINNPDAAAFDDYGSALAVTINGDIIVSARFKDNFAANDGSVFVHDGLDGDLLWSVANPTADAEGLFATALAVTPQGHVVVGAANDDSGAMNSGRAFVYNGSDGTLIKIIDNSEPEENVNFGQGLAVTPNGQIAVGAFGADGGFGKLYLFASVGEGETLTLVNELPFTDTVLQACVLNEAASNGWSIVDEVTTLNCANGDITDLTGLEALTDLDTLDLSGNTDILCADLDALEVALPNTTVTRPATCNNGGNPQSQQVQNLHNAQGQRVVKTVNGDANTAIHFLYDQSGQVIAEIDATTGATLREYIYVNGQQIAIVDDTGTQEEETYFVHNDHLGTPQKITDQTQAIVWDATYKPFGDVEVATQEIENNIRFPGQYADEETGLHYNYFRDYDPTTGRYVESDPIGLRGGANTFGYVNSNPVLWLDPRGLELTSKDAYLHYMLGNGAPWAASFSEVDVGLAQNDFPNYSAARDSYIQSAPTGNVPFSDTRAYDVGGAVFGNITFSLRGVFSSDNCSWMFVGTVGALNDVFDFNPANRPFFKEAATRFLNRVLVNGVPYTISFSGSRLVFDGGAL